ncbi:hypothetical protein HOLleu_42044 [Holothuria leucospilota]|uniref:Ig-like domain-containing protein n=1 Tax=Holothuria leucospilota TaxID=206669 RepID=A0A9Q0YB12_HOLLE|nr:hypothetical protein HOLleu_42044 [Holothuria leucospilota]
MSALFSVSGEERHEYCKSPQHLELGTTGTIRCSFEEGFFGVFWYNSSDVEERAIITLKDTVKDGEGYLSGEFDIQSDGSLIINHVSLRHDKVFTVVVFNSTLQDPVHLSVRVVVYVNPFPRYPVVHDCENQGNCVLEKQREDVITCSVYGIRPEVNLEWKILHGREEFPHFFSNHNLTVTKDENTFDIFLTSVFQSTVEYEERMTIECKISEPMAMLFPISSKVVLSFTEGKL